MKRIFSVKFVAAVILAALMTFDAQAQYDTFNYEFATTNPLASGKWVKISFNGSGVYEISYDRLREMGFENPSKVSVYGTGGQKRSHQFLSTAGKRQVEDVIAQVPVMHRDNKLVFYGQGDKVMKFSTYISGSTYNPCFRRESLNSYSETTYYMLTDSKPVTTVSKASVADKESATLSDAFGYLFHEDELFNGPNDSGEMWFGDNLPALGSVEYPLTAPYCTAGKQAYAYPDVAANCGYSGQFITTLNGSSSVVSLGALSASTIQQWANTNEDTAFTDVDANRVATGTLGFSISSTAPSWETIAIDCWTVVYPTDFSYFAEDPGFSQFTAGFNHMLDNKWKHNIPAGLVAWDVTDPLVPYELDSADGYIYSDEASARSVVAFNPEMTLKQINPGFVNVTNQDLHALAANEYDMLIITLPAFKKFADGIADLHARYDGQRCLVVLSEEAFNEFNAGTPDAMAYRMLAKMLYQHPSRSLKNLLFVGPLRGDFRNIRGVPNPRDAMIAFQDFNLDLRAISNPNMDFYGIMTDNVRYISRLETAPIALGVGILPIDNDQDGELILDKIRGHLEKKDFSGMVNETYTIGCAGDGHIHENQSIRMGVLLQSYASDYLESEFAHDALWLDAMNNDQGRELIQNAMRRGKGFINYFGHAGLSGFGAFSAYDAMNAGNNEQGLALFAGCELCQPDRGLHGMGDLPVIRSRQGFIGSISATRSVLSNHNETLARYIANSIFLDMNDRFRTETPTIGEIYARGKDRTTNNSELAYVLVGDPALRVPMALTKVKMSIPDRKYRAGETIAVTGQVVDNETGNVRSDYNGYVTLKLMEPTRRVVTPPASSSSEQKMDDYDVNDLPVIAVNGPVKNGRFSLRVPLPAMVESFMSEDDENITNMLLLAGTYDPSTYLGGSGRMEIPMGVMDSEADPYPNLDTKAPEVLVMYDEELSIIKIHAMEDVAMSPGIGAGGGVTLIINGEEMSVGQNYSTDVYVTSFEGTADMGRLPNGRYTARTYATDLAGNVSEVKELEFDVQSGAMITLEAASKIAVDEVEFSLTNMGSGELTLYLLDRAGNIAVERAVNDSSLTLDISGLAPGNYRAYVHRNAPSGTKMNSNMVEFTVID